MCNSTAMSEQNNTASSDTAMDYHSDSDSATDQQQLDDPQPTPKKVKKQKPGIIYLSTVPYGMTSSAIRNYFSKYGEVKNVFFQLADRENYVGGLVGGSYHNQKKKPPKRGRLIKGRVRFSEGWIEFASRKKAKWVAEMCNNSPVGGKKSSPYYDCLWSIRYLGKRFLWGELSKRISFEKEMHQRKMTNEIRKVTQETDDYIKASVIAERMERRNNQQGGQAGVAAGGSEAGSGAGTLKYAAVGIKQRLTEAEILEKQREKKLKDQKFKAKLQKAKLKKQAVKQQKKVERKEQAKSLNLFVAKT